MSTVDNSGADALLTGRIVRDEYADGTTEETRFAQGDNGMKLKQKKFRNGDVEYYEGNDERLAQRVEADGTVKRFKGPSKREWIKDKRQNGVSTVVYGGVPPDVYKSWEFDHEAKKLKIFTRVGQTSESVCNREVRSDGDTHVRRGEGYAWHKVNVPAEHLRPPTPPPPPPPPPTAAELAARERERAHRAAVQSAASRHARDSWADQNKGNAPMRAGRFSEVDMMGKKDYDQGNC